MLFELDQLQKRFNKSPQDRLTFLSKYPSLIEERDDLYIEYVLLLSISGNTEKAKLLLADRKFHPWEGGEGKTSGQHIHVYVELAKQSLEKGEYDKALFLLDIARHYPENLGEGKLYGFQENDIDYWTGCVYDNVKDNRTATEYWSKASIGLDELTQAIFYNDQQPDKIFYQGLALQKLGKEAAAEVKFKNLIRYAVENLDREVRMDYFAVSLPDLSIFDDDLNIRNNIHCLYLSGLGYLGLKNYGEAKSNFEDVLKLDNSHLGARVHLAAICKIKNESVQLAGL